MLVPFCFFFFPATCCFPVIWFSSHCMLHRAHTNSCPVKLTFTTAQSCGFLRSRPTSHARSSKHQQTTSSRPPFFRRGLPTIHHTSQPIPSTVLGAEPIPDACPACLACSAKLVSNIMWPLVCEELVFGNGVSWNSSRCPQLTDAFRPLIYAASLGCRLLQTPFAPSVCLLVCSSPCPATRACCPYTHPCS